MLERVVDREVEKSEEIYLQLICRVYEQAGGHRKNTSQCVGGVFHASIQASKDVHDEVQRALSLIDRADSADTENWCDIFLLESHRL
jgi:hypothetical protein